MMKLQDATDEENKTHEATFGGFNDVPEGFREISEKDFVQGDFFRYPFERYEFRQIFKAGLMDENGHSMYNVKLFFLPDGTGVGMMDDHWAGKIRYFAFGCDHQYRDVYGQEAKDLGLMTGGSLRAYVCDLCGHKMVQDSSD
jgi:hypothetical protein